MHSSLGLLTRRLLVAAFFFAAMCPAAQTAAEEVRRTPGVLVSSAPERSGSTAAAAPAAPKNTMRLRFVPKNPPAGAPAQPSPRTSSVSVASSAAEPPAQSAEGQVGPTAEEEYILARSRQKHPLAVDVENASPVKQVVGSPKTIDYSTARTAYVLDPGQPAAGGSGTVRMRPRQATTES